MGTYNDTFNNKLLSYFKRGYRNLKKSTKGWYRLDCPFCSGNNSFGINPLINRSKCHKCGYSKTLFKTVAEIENKETYNDTLVFLDENFEGEFSIFKKAPKIQRRKLELPKSFKLISLGNSFIGETARGYIRKRGFDETYLTMKGVGYCDDGKYIGSLIFPFYYNGELVYFTNRRFLMGLGSQRKFDNPVEEEFGIGKSKLIYNRDALYIYKKIYITESVTNSLTLKDKAIGLGGKSISDYQFSDIIRSPVERVSIMLDPDAISEAIKLALRLAPYKMTKLVYWPGDEDVNKMGRKRALELEKQFHYQTYKELVKIKTEYDYQKESIYTHN